MPAAIGTERFVLIGVASLLHAKATEPPHRRTELSITGLAIGPPSDNCVVKGVLGTVRGLARVRRRGVAPRGAKDGITLRHLCLCPVSNSVRSLREMGFVSYVSDDGVGDRVPVGPAGLSGYHGHSRL